MRNCLLLHGAVLAAMCLVGSACAGQRLPSECDTGRCSGKSHTELLAETAKRLPTGKAIYWMGSSVPVFSNYAAATGEPIASTPWVYQEPYVPGFGRVYVCTVTYLRPAASDAFRPHGYQRLFRATRPHGEAVVVYARAADERTITSNVVNHLKARLRPYPK